MNLRKGLVTIKSKFQSYTCVIKLFMMVSFMSFIQKCEIQKKFCFKLSLKYVHVEMTNLSTIVQISEVA